MRMARFGSSRDRKRAEPLAAQHTSDREQMDDGYGNEHGGHDVTPAGSYNPTVAGAELATSDLLMAATILVASLVLVLAPPLAVWRTLGRPGVHRQGWARAAGALLAPFVITILLVVLAWLPQYRGQCGGWLGETAPCRGFGQYAGETLFWAAMSLGVPALLGFLLGLIALTIRVVRRRGAGPAA